METLREKFAGVHKSKVRLIYDVWKEKGSVEREQIQLPYMNIEEVIDRYGDFIYHCWYTDGWEKETGRTLASLWAFADDKHRVDPVLYEKWKREGLNEGY